MMDDDAIVAAIKRVVAGAFIETKSTRLWTLPALAALVGIALVVIVVFASV
jgi:hypothetical protein